MKLIRTAKPVRLGPDPEPDVKVYGGTIEEAVDWLLALARQERITLVVEEYLEEGRVTVVGGTIYVSQVVYDAVMARAEVAK